MTKYALTALLLVVVALTTFMCGALYARDTDRESRTITLVLTFGVFIVQAIWIFKGLK